MSMAENVDADVAAWLNASLIEDKTGSWLLIEDAHLIADNQMHQLTRHRINGR